MSRFKSIKLLLVTDTIIYTYLVLSKGNIDCCGIIIYVFTFMNFIKSGISQSFYQLNILCTFLKI